MPGRAVIVVSVLVILFLGIGAVATQYQDTVRDTQPLNTIENETFTVSAGDTLSLDESNRDVVYNDSVTVRQNGTTFDPAGNYTWRGDTGDGQLEIPTDTGLTDGDSANITYSYRVPSESQSITKSIGMIPFELAEELALIGGFILMLGALAMLLKGGGY